jgi:exopolyphosphatase/guanosine-5'-triphosphate,3'-diphosphate pyrophosphatase
MIRAAIDIGSNTTLFLVGRQGEEGQWLLLEESLTTNGLGWEIAQHGSISLEAQQRNLHILKGLIARAHGLGCQEIRAVGTAALRKASNAEAFVKSVFKETGLEIAVISGQEEARLTYLGAMIDRRDVFHASALCVVDVGGGSSEVVFGKGLKVQKAFSLSLGAVSLTQSIPNRSGQPLTEKQKRQIQEVVSSNIGNLTADLPDVITSVIAVGGTASTLAALTLGVDISKLWRHPPVQVPVPAVKAFWQDFAGRSVQEIAEIPHLPPDRAEIITAGTAILLGILEKLHTENVNLSNKGLRWGLLIDDKYGGTCFTRPPIGGNYES